MKKIKSFYLQYRFLKMKVNDKLSVRQVFGATLGTLVLTSLSLLIPVLLTYNLFVLSHLIKILIGVSVLLIAGFSYLFHFFYYLIVSTYLEETKIKTYQKVIVADAILTFVVLIFFMVVIISSL